MYRTIRPPVHNFCKNNPHQSGYLFKDRILVVNGNDVTGTFPSGTFPGRGNTPWKSYIDNISPIYFRITHPESTRIFVFLTGAIWVTEMLGNLFTIRNVYGENGTCHNSPDVLDILDYITCHLRHITNGSVNLANEMMCKIRLYSPQWKCERELREQEWGERYMFSPYSGERRALFSPTTYVQTRTVFGTPIPSSIEFRLLLKFDISWQRI